MGAETISQWYSIYQREDLTSDAQNPWKARCGDIPVIPALLQQEWSGCRGTPKHWCTENNIICLQPGKSQDPHQRLSSDLHTVTSSHILTLMYTAVNNTQLSPSRWRARTHTKAPQQWCLTSCPPIFTQTQTSFAHIHKHTKKRTTKVIGYTFSTTKHWPYLNIFNNIGLRTISVLSTVITSSMAVGKATEPALLCFPDAATEGPGQNHLGRKVLRWLTQYSSSQESDVGTQTGTWRQELMKHGPQGNTAYWLSPLGSSATYLKQPSITCSGVELPTRVWASYTN